MTTPQIVGTVGALRAMVGDWRRQGLRVALVPTMGALHAGHVALIEAARANAERVVVSIFVNPTQFAPNEDFAAYPRNESADIERIGGAGGDAVFMPGVGEMYPQGFATTVLVKGPAEGLETDFRPHFFAGVATVVAKLLLAALPDVAIFGEKDFQQLVVIRRMVADLGIPVTIAGHPTVREPDGLALSSRNAYLSPVERSLAPRLYQALVEATASIRAGRPRDEALAAARRQLDQAGFRVDYVELRDAETLAPAGEAGPFRLLAAARLGKTRLIDNVAV